jgi:GNAT superfamily N-acetyltransferase
LKLPHANLEVRRVGPEESWAAITALLHRAYAPLAQRGLQFHASYQDEAVTQSRCSEGECYIALVDGVLAGTITALPAGRISDLSWYTRSDTASMGQLAVEPARQAQGVGAALTTRAEARAVEWGASQIAIDTSEHANELLALYRRRGYQVVDAIRWRVTNYRSLVLVKRLVEP